MKNNAAIYMLSSRVLILEQCLLNLYKNWNNKYDYPVYIHYFDNIYSKEFINKIKNTISKKIFFYQIDYKVPEHIDEKELFYNKVEIPYVKKSFSKKRLGYLHGERFWLNLTSYGKVGCLVKELEKYDYLMRIDDDSYFKGNIDFDLFDILNEYPIASAYMYNRYTDRVRDTRLGLWDFYKSYLKKFNYIPKNLKLRKAVNENNEAMMHNLYWTAGNCNLYNILEFKKKPWEEYQRELNRFGGHYKNRWGDLETIGLFCYTHFDKEPYNFNLKEKGLYNDKFPTYLSSTAPGVGESKNFNVHNFFLKRWYYSFIFFLKSFFKKKD
tara:strand:- start:165 stop:1139 length:975 start_codon:yes stop_codon:yes gene_type:complete